MVTSTKTRCSPLVEFRRCRCGATPAIAEAELDAGVMAYAVHCSKLCGDDSHWQMSLTEAIKRWNAGLVREASGGNGAAADDLQAVKH